MVMPCGGAQQNLPWCAPQHTAQQPQLMGMAHPPRPSQPALEPTASAQKAAAEGPVSDAAATGSAKASTCSRAMPCGCSQRRSTSRCPGPASRSAGRRLQSEPQGTHQQSATPAPRPAKRSAAPAPYSQRRGGPHPRWPWAMAAQPSQPPNGKAHTAESSLPAEVVPMVLERRSGLTATSS